MKRRTFLQGTVAAGAAGLAMSAGILTPRIVMAEGGGAFDAKTLDDALKAMALTPEESKDITIKAPEIAENGAVVPVTVSTTIKDAKEISILVADNPTPLVATFTLGEGAEAMASTRIKMGKTSKIMAVVKTADKAYSAKQEVKVTIGGCGG